MIFQEILILTLIRFSRYPTKNFTRWRFSKFRRAGNSSCSHAGTFSRTLLLLRTRTKLFVFRGFDIQGKPGRILPNYRPEAILSIYKANTEIQYKKVLPGHHQLDIPVSLIADIEAGFAQLERAGKLKQGNGLFKFQDFQIHI